MFEKSKELLLKLPVQELINLLEKHGIEFVKMNNDSVENKGSDKHGDVSKMEEHY